MRSRYIFLQKETFRSRYTPLNGQDNTKPFIKTRYRHWTDVFKILFKIDPLNHNFGRFC